MRLQFEANTYHCYTLAENPKKQSTTREEINDPLYHLCHLSDFTHAHFFTKQVGIVFIPGLIKRPKDKYDYTEISNLEELADNDDFNIGVIRGGSTMRFFMVNYPDFYSSHPHS